MLYAAVGSTGGDIVTAAATGLEMSTDASTGQSCDHGNNKCIDNCDWIYENGSKSHDMQFSIFLNVFHNISI